MRYQNPSIESAVTSLAAKGVDQTFLIPLFPHYAMSSYESAVVRVQEVARRIAPGMTVEVMPPYYDHPDYIKALIASASDSLAQPHDHVLFSFHGLPERHMRKADPTGSHCLASPDCCETPSVAHKTCYRAQCFQTVRDFVASAQIPAGKYSVSFQSRLGREPWMQPYTDEVLAQLAQSGIKSSVLCPAFVLRLSGDPRGISQPRAGVVREGGRHGPGPGAVPNEHRPGSTPSADGDEPVE